MKSIRVVPQDSTTTRMKTTKSLSLHKTFSKGEDGKRKVTLFVYDGVAIKKFVGDSKTYFDFLGGLLPGTVVRMTSVASLDGLVRYLSDKGVTIQFAHWHNTGIDKNLTPEEIVVAYHAVDSSKFREFKYDTSLAELRMVLSERNALLGFYNSALLRLRQAQRNSGVAEAEEVEEFHEDVSNLDALFGMFKAKGNHDREVSYETRIGQLASQNELCRLFNKTAGLSEGSWITAASIVCIAQGVERFPRVSDFLSYFGMGDAKKQKRTKGQPSNWSAAGRTVCYNLGLAVIKNKNNPWRPMFDEAKEEYLAKHKATCGCKAERGHPDAQARRKVVKEILKRFYLAASGIPYHTSTETQSSDANAAAAGE